MKTRLLTAVCIVLAQLFFAQTSFKKGQTPTPFFTETSDGTKLFTKVSGTGDLCIYVHGGPGMWSDSFENLKGKNLESNLKMVLRGRVDVAPITRSWLGAYLRDNPDVGAYVDGNLATFLGSRTNGAIAHYIIYGADEGRLAYTTESNAIESALLIGILTPT